MAAGFQRHIGGCAARPRAGGVQSDDLGVRFASALVPAFADEGSILDQHATHSRVGIGAGQAAPGERQGRAM